jgi:hypothetical protein
VIDDILDIEGDTENWADRRVNEDQQDDLSATVRHKEVKRDNEDLIADAKDSLSLFSSEADPLREKLPAQKEELMVLDGVISFGPQKSQHRRVDGAC